MAEQWVGESVEQRFGLLHFIVLTRDSRLKHCITLPSLSQAIGSLPTKTTNGHPWTRIMKVNEANGE